MPTVPLKGDSNREAAMMVAVLNVISGEKSGAIIHEVRAPKDIMDFFRNIKTGVRSL